MTSWLRQRRRTRRIRAVTYATFPAKGFLASMRINGTWHTCDDGELRPVLLGAMIAADSRWLSVPFLVDTGADRTVIYCVISRAEVAQMKSLVRDTDPYAFMVIGHANEALGEGFQPLDG